MAERLFVYGTLHPHRAPNEIADVVRRFKSLGSGKVHGRIYNFGDFPGIILDPSAGPIDGNVYQLPEDGEALSRLDAYEEYSPSSPEESLFLRQKTTVQFADGAELDCWIYVYNRSVHGHTPRPNLASVA